MQDFLFFSMPKYKLSSVRQSVARKAKSRHNMGMKSWMCTNKTESGELLMEYQRIILHKCNQTLSGAAPLAMYLEFSLNYCGLLSKPWSWRNLFWKCQGVICFLSASNPTPSWVGSDFSLSHLRIVNVIIWAKMTQGRNIFLFFWKCEAFTLTHL